MAVLTQRQTVEAFHLHFLRALLATSDRNAFALKGGCNLRFFFGSVRYSKDIDLDVSVVAKATLKNKVDRVLESPALRLPLRSLGIELVDASASKQTDTTQRWKMGLKLEGAAIAARTKIEFSRRDELSGARLEPVGSRIATAYRIPGFLASHYDLPAAISQKLAALVGRAETQARDLFDLELLLARLPTEKASKKLRGIVRKSLEAAHDRILKLSFGDFASQVVAYLEPDFREQYDSADAWEQLQLSVIARLEELAQ